MADSAPSLSTDQLSAFVALARAGSIRQAATGLHITEQGLRNRLVALESRLGVELYRKQRGIRRHALLTAHGRNLLPHAISFLDRARELGELFGSTKLEQEVHVAASHYLTYYFLIDALKRFRRKFPHIRIRLSTMTEQQIENALLDNTPVSIGIAAPYEPVGELSYEHLFSLKWSLIVPKNHPLLERSHLSIKQLVDQPLILFERGSTGRRHIIEAFRNQGLSPKVEMEMTNTQIIVRMVEAGLGISIVPLPADGSVTRGHGVVVRSLGRQIPSIRSGILTRRKEELSPASRQFIEYLGTDKRIRTFAGSS